MTMLVLFVVGDDDVGCLEVVVVVGGGAGGSEGSVCVSGEWSG